MLVSRMFNTKEDATSAVNDLTGVGFRDVAVRVIEKTDTPAPDRAFLLAQGVTDARAEQYAEALGQGGALLIVDAPVGAAGIAKEILERPRPSDTASATAEYEAVTRNDPERVPLDSATPLSSKLNWPVLLHDPAPLSRFLNIPTLSPPPTSKPKSHGLPFLSDNPTPLSSRFGMRVLSENPTPLSTRLGKKTLLDSPTPLSDWLGKKVLINNPTPLSSWLNWRVLSGDTKPRGP